MKGYFLRFGFWSSTLQMGLIYTLSFLYSATALAYVSLMLCWFAGSAAGAWLGSRRSWPWCLLTLALYLLHLHLLGQHHPHLAPLAALAGGASGGHWVVRWGQAALANTLAWETLGMAVGWWMCSLGLYWVAMPYLWCAPIFATLLVTWREPLDAAQGGVLNR